MVIKGYCLSKKKINFKRLWKMKEEWFLLIKKTKKWKNKNSITLVAWGNLLAIDT